jgi:RNA polymerase sigma-70 factor (ECF subfamily)
VGQLEFNEFYRSGQAVCLRAVLASVGDRQLAEDLVAEAFTRAWMSWAKVRRHPAPYGWVVRTALNVRLSWWRRRRREVALDMHGTREVEDTAARSEVVDPVLLAALRRLPRRQQEVIVLRVFLDLDTRATANVLGIAEGTVAVHLARGLATLRHSLVVRRVLEVEP